MQAVQQKHYYECPSCRSRFFSEPVTLGVKNGQLVKIHPICTKCFNNCPRGHEFGYGEQCNVCGEPRRRFNLIRYAIPDDDPTFGLTSTGSTTYPISKLGPSPLSTNAGVENDYLRMNRYQMTVNGTITAIHVKGGANGNAKVGIYSDNAGAPNALLTGPTASAVSSGVEATISIAAIYVVSGTYIWLCANFDVDEVIQNHATSGGTYAYKALAYTGAWPNPITGTSAWTGVLAINADYVQIEGYAKATKATLTEDAPSVTSMSFYSHATGNARLAIYDDSSGPNTLKWASPSTACAATAWTTVNISAGTPNTLALSAGTYWLAWQWDSVNRGPSYTAGGANTGAYFAQAYDAFPDPLAGETLSTETWSLYVTYVVAEAIDVTDTGAGTELVGVEEDLTTITDAGVGTELVYLLGEVLIDGLRLDHALKIRVSEPTIVSSKPVSVGLPTRIYLGGQGRTLEIDGWVATIAELNALTALADGAVHEVQLPTGSRVSVHIPDANPTRPIEPGQYPYTIRAVERMD